MVTASPKVSVLVTNHNYGRFVGDAIRSALEQTYGEIEVIVCDDGSTDESPEVLSEFVDEARVRIVRQENGGQASALTKAAGLASGDILCLLDADDVFLPTKIEKVVRAFDAAPHGGLVMHRVLAVDEMGSSLQEIPQFGSLRGGRLRDDVIRRGGRWVTAPCSALAIRSAWKTSVFPIPNELRTGADAFVFGLMPLLTEVVVIDEPLSRYRVHGGNAYGAVSITSSTAEHGLRELELVTGCVNERLATVGDEARIDVERNLYWHQHRATIALLTRPSREEAARATRGFVRELREDDLWPSAVRLALSFIYRVAPWLPLPARRRWLNLALGLSRTKRLAGRMLRR